MTEKNKVIILQTLSDDEKPKRKCDICGKSTGIVSLWFGGFLSHAHVKCAKVASKSVKLYLRLLVISPSGMAMFLRDMKQAEKETNKIFETLKGE